MKHLGMAALAAGLLSASPAVASVVIYSNFSSDPSNPAYPYTATASGYYVEWVQSETHPGYQTAMSFTVSTGYDIPLQSVALAIYKWPTGVNHDNLTIELVGGNTSLPDPGDLITTLSVNPAIVGGAANILTLDAPTHPVLQDGQTYWVIAEPTAISTTDSSDDSVYVWIYNDVGIKGKWVANEYTSSSWGGFFAAGANIQVPTLEVLGESPAPEPATLALFGTGILGLLLMRGRQARGAAIGRTRPGL